MIWEGCSALPFVLETKVIILEHETEGTSERALSLFAAKAQRAVGLRGEVNIRITSSRELQELNRRFRKKNQPTDVLSFPSETPKLAGDIAISAEIAAANAASLGHSAQTELKILILHGLLHLAGYDHETDDGEMRSRETSLAPQTRPAGRTDRASAQPAESRPRASAQVCQLTSAAEAPADEPSVSHPAAGLDGAAGAGLLCRSALRRDGKVPGARVPGEHRRLRAAGRARLHVSRERAALSMAVLTQLCMASIGVLIGYVLFMEKRWVVLDLVQAAVSLIFIIVIFNRLLPYLFFVRTRGEWLVHWVPVLRVLIYLALPATLILGFALSVASLSKRASGRSSRSIRPRPWTR